MLLFSSLALEMLFKVGDLGLHVDWFRGSYRLMALML